MKKSPNSVIPAKAGIQKEYVTPQLSHWIPAFAGMTRPLYVNETIIRFSSHWIPAFAGMTRPLYVNETIIRFSSHWIPAFAGMTRGV